MNVYNLENIAILAGGIIATIMIIKKIVLLLDQKENK